MKVRIEHGEEAIAAFDGEWDALVFQQPVPNPTLSSAWLREMATWDPRETLLAITVRDGGRLVAGGAFALRKSNRGPVTVATWPGGYGPPLYQPDILADAPDHGAEVIEALFSETRAAILVRTPLAGAAAQAIRQAAPWAAIANDWGDGWIVELPPPVLARRERQVAVDRRRAERQGVRVAVEVRREPAAVAEALERLFDLHRRRWETRRDDMSRFSKSAGERAWHRQALGRLAEEHRVIITEVREDGRLVASTLVLLAGQGALFHTTAMAPGGVLQSPGHPALLAALVAAQEAGATVMHLGRGAGEHKLRWQPERDRLARIAAARSPGQQRLLAAALRVDSSLAALVHASVRRLHGLAARPR